MTTSEEGPHSGADGVSPEADQPAPQSFDTTAQPAPPAPSASPEPTAPAARRVLGERYELGEIVGRGGMSTVHRAYDRHTGQYVAVKVFRAGTDLLHADRRYRREVDLLSTLSAPGLVALLDADLGETATPYTTPYLVTELVDGLTLSKRIKQSTLTEEQVARLGAALCTTLAYVHQHGIVHRDVKPSNILIPNGAEDGLSEPKLVDFGIAVATDDTRLTLHDSTIGTANYLSPEQVRGELVTSASDIFSLGLVLIEAMTGTYAYPGKGIETAVMRLSRPPDIPPTMSRALSALLTDMTAHEPSDRPDAQQTGARLAQLTVAGDDGSLAVADEDGSLTEILPFIQPAKDLPGEPVGRAVSAPPRGLRPRSRYAIGLASAAAAVVVAAIGVAAMLNSPGHKPAAPVNPTPQQAAPPIHRLPATQATSAQANTSTRLLGTEPPVDEMTTPSETTPPTSPSPSPVSTPTDNHASTTTPSLSIPPSTPAGSPTTDPTTPQSSPPPTSPSVPPSSPGSSSTPPSSPSP